MPLGHLCCLICSRQTSSFGKSLSNWLRVYRSSFGMVCLRLMATLDNSQYAICSTCCQGIITLFSAPQRYSQREFCYAFRDNSYFTFLPPHGLPTPYRVGIFLPISPLVSNYFAAIL